MTKDEEKMLYAMAALIGLVMKGEAPAAAADKMWTYAEFAIKYKENQE